MANHPPKPVQANRMQDDWHQDDQFENAAEALAAVTVANVARTGAGVNPR